MIPCAECCRLEVMELRTSGLQRHLPKELLPVEATRRSSAIPKTAGSLGVMLTAHGTQTLSSCFFAMFLFACVILHILAGKFSEFAKRARLNGDWMGVGTPFCGHPNFASWAGFSMSSRRFLANASHHPIIRQSSAVNSKNLQKQ